MNTNNTIILNLLERMVKDGYSEFTITKFKSVFNKFERYMLTNAIDEIDEEAVISFLDNEYSINYFNPKNNNELAKIKYLKNLIEYKNTGNYLRHHSSEKIKLNNFSEIYNDYNLYLDTKDIADITRQCKMIKIKLFLNSLDNLSEIENLEKKHCYNFINNLNYSLRYKEELTYELRRFINWLYSNKVIEFDGYDVFPRIIGQERNNIISYYDKDEIEKILNIVDVATSVGKRDYLILSLIIYLGLRISDVINLKTTDINWNLNTINIVQKKTNMTLVLPLIDQIKYPLLDYLKNVRGNIKDEYIFVTLHAPIEKCSSKSFQIMVTKYMNMANIDYTNKHHGPHSLRHTLASNLLRENVPITTISSVLGHSSIKTTQKYLTIDTNNLKQLSLEVPNV